MHIVFIVDSDAFGGAEVYTRILLRRLPATFRRTLVVSEPVARHFADGHPAGPVVTAPATGIATAPPSCRDCCVRCGPTRSRSTS